MRYTPSVDGLERCTVHIPVRVTRRQIQILTRMGIDKRRPWREVLGGLIGTAIDVEIENWDYENAEGAAIEGA